MSSNRKTIEKKMCIEFRSSWCQELDRKEVWSNLIRNQLEQLFPRYPNQSSDRELLITLLKEISDEFDIQKNTITLADIARSATSPSALFRVDYQIKAYDIFSITINSLIPHKKEESCYVLDLDFHFSRRLTFPTNPFSHDHEQVNIAFVVDKDCDFLQKQEKDIDYSPCIIL